MVSDAGPWTGDSERHNAECGRRWLPLNRSSAAPNYPEAWYWEQCGGCRFWIALQGRIGMDWGVCTNTSAFDGRVRFEHDGCDAFEARDDGSFG
ncbi:DUF3027 domain-containing protein [Nocardia sp. GAS34]|uniref:DUF3027 domain-containing protein n=1 Tax=unclassified Nocardia TaxID=2637762 RepID=UPI003D1CC6A1